MKKLIYLAVVCVMAAGSVVWADTFGSGANAFNIDFVSISGNASSANGTFIGDNKPEGFSDPGNYRMGTYEITNAQWNKFKAAYGPVAGTPTGAYGIDVDYWTDENVPTNRVSWYEAAQFVNYLNTSKGCQAAYKFTGTQGTSGYTLGVWQVGDTGFNASNPYRNSNAFYFLPTEDEWVKAAYWNGTNLQAYATKTGETLFQSNGSNGGWNYVGALGYPWDVGSGSQELNGTYDMMGNMYEWMESPWATGDYLSGSLRGLRGGSSGGTVKDLSLSGRLDYGFYPPSQWGYVTFRVASVPEPCSLILLSLGGLALAKRKRSM